MDRLKDIIKGGLGDDIDPSQFDQKQVMKGIHVELEHTGDILTALEITLDHLVEDPDYYKKLEKIHKENKSKMKSKNSILIEAITKNELKNLLSNLKQTKSKEEYVKYLEVLSSYLGSKVKMSKKQLDNVVGDIGKKLPDASSSSQTDRNVTTYDDVDTDSPEDNIQTAKSAISQSPEDNIDTAKSAIVGKDNNKQATQQKATGGNRPKPYTPFSATQKDKPEKGGIPNLQKTIRQKQQQKTGSTAKPPPLPSKTAKPSTTASPSKQSGGSNTPSLASLAGIEKDKSSSISDLPEIEPQADIEQEFPKSQAHTQDFKVPDWKEKEDQGKNFSSKLGKYASRLKNKRK